MIQRNIIEHIVIVFLLNWCVICELGLHFLNFVYVFLLKCTWLLVAFSEMY